MGPLGPMGLGDPRASGDPWALVDTGGPMEAHNLDIVGFPRTIGAGGGAGNEWH